MTRLLASLTQESPMSDTPPTAPATTVKPSAPRPTFLTFLEAVNHGRLAANSTEELEVLVRELRALAQVPNMKPKGKIRIELSIEALPNGLMDVIGDVKLTMPRRPKERSAFWPTRENCLSAVNPAQLGIPGLDVTAPQRPRVVD